jgi:DNA replication protein DnaC
MLRRSRMARRTKRTEELRSRVLEHFRNLRVALSPEDLDGVLAKAQREGLSHLAFLHALIGEQANLRRERSIERRIRAARFSERKTLEEFDWGFNRNAIDRIQIEELATAEFIHRKDNLLIVGQSGVGKSHIVQAIGIRACIAGCSVRYTTSAELIETLTSALADKSLPKKLRQYTRPELLVVDEFGFDRVERMESPQSASLLYKVVDARHRKGSIALVTNIDFDAWGAYLGDPPLSMALLDRLVHHATIIKIPQKARSYRSEAAKRRNASRQAKK